MWSFDYLTDPDFINITLNLGDQADQYQYQVFVKTLISGLQSFDMQALFYITGTCALSKPPNSLAYFYRIDDFPITVDLAKHYIEKHPMCQVKYQEVILEPTNMMNSQFAFVWKDLENPGRYIIQTT
jgi:hypothetical protein